MQTKPKELKDLSDSQLLRSCKTGSEAAFNVLFRRHFDDLLQFAIRQLNNQEQAEELVMDLMLKLWQMPAETPEIQDLKPYLFRSVKNALISHWRKKSLSVISLDELSASEDPLTKPADHGILDAEVQLLYRHKLDGLSPQRRLVYNLSREQGMTNSEIATATNLSVITVKKHLKASLDYFRKNLKPHTNTWFILLATYLF